MIMPLCLANRLNLNTLNFDQDGYIEANTRSKNINLKKPSVITNLIWKISHTLKVHIIVLANRLKLLSKNVEAKYLTWTLSS